jgi:hypothetical protein
VRTPYWLITRQRAIGSGELLLFFKKNRVCAAPLSIQWRLIVACRRSCRQTALFRLSPRMLVGSERAKSKSGGRNSSSCHGIPHGAGRLSPAAAETAAVLSGYDAKKVRSFPGPCSRASSSSRDQAERRFNARFSQAIDRNTDQRGCRIRTRSDAFRCGGSFQLLHQT